MPTFASELFLFLASQKTSYRKDDVKYSLLPASVLVCLYVFDYYFVCMLCCVIVPESQFTAITINLFQTICQSKNLRNKIIFVYRYRCICAYPCILSEFDIVVSSLSMLIGFSSKDHSYHLFWTIILKWGNKPKQPEDGDRHHYNHRKRTRH